MFDLDKTRSLERLFAIPEQQRDAAWTEAFLDAAWFASISVPEPNHFDGPDGFPYWRLNLPSAHTSFDSQCLANLARQCCEYQAGAAVFASAADPDSNPQYVFSMGTLDSLLRFDSPDGDPLDRAESDPSSKTQTFFPAVDDPQHEFLVTAKAHDVLTGAPSRDFLPPYTARGIARYMTIVWGIEAPRVGLMVNTAIAPSRALIIGRKRSSFASEEEIARELRRLSWFLPSWRSIILLPEEWALSSLTPLAELGE